MSQKIERTIGVNEDGMRIGEYHPRAKLTDREVEKIRHFREIEKMTYQQIAQIFEINRWAVGKICRYQLRNQFAVRFKKVVVEV